MARANTLSRRLRTRPRSLRCLRRNANTPWLTIRLYLRRSVRAENVRDLPSGQRNSRPLNSRKFFSRGGSISRCNRSGPNTVHQKTAHC